MGRPSSLACSRCGRRYEPNQLLTLCECGGPLLVQYDFAALRASWSCATLGQPLAYGLENSMWRYAPVLPVDPEDAVTLREGWTPLLPAHRLQQELGITDLWIKDEGRNPTDSFKARGLACAVTMARKFGITKVAIPSAGNAAGALAAYAARAGIDAYVFMPSDVPQANYLECTAHGANVTLVNGLINDCGRIVAERKKQEGWFDISTLKEPYRIEGKKTMGYEIAEQFGWRLPEAILYPCGGGVGLIGIWKAFDEMEQLGWIGAARPKMIAVQAEGCAPIVRAFREETKDSIPWANAFTVASGLRVPKPLGDALVLEALKASRGTAISVTDEEMLDGAVQMARAEGIFAAPEGGACIAALRKLLQTRFLASTDRIVILNTGSGYKYGEAFGTRWPRRNASEQDKLGGLITPR